MGALKLNTSYKHHLIVALIVSIWLIAFLVLIAPFDAADLPLITRLKIMPIYGIVSFVSYIVLIPFQNAIFKKSGTWTVILEICFIVLFNLITFFGSYIYYQSGIVNGDYTFTEFAFEIYTPICFILLPILVFARWYMNRKVIQKETNKITIKGDNKLDVLHINFSDLVCIASADNYVEIYYLKTNSLSKKLLRNTLQNMHHSIPDLVRVHRSYLINPSHIREWKNANTLNLTEIEVPVSKNYKQAIVSFQNSPLKT